MKDGGFARTRTDQRRTRALVLSGGGGRGAYQVGVVKALLESGMCFDYIFGASVGALNAVMIAQGELERLEELWCGLRPQDIIRLPSASHLRQLLTGKWLGMLDTTPLENLIRQQANLGKLKSSPTKVAFFTVDLHSVESRMVTTDSLYTTEALVESLMATCAIPVLFPPRRLDGSGQWVDAGLVTNTPIRAALEAGFDELIVVLMEPTKKRSPFSNLLQIVARCVDISLYAGARKELDLLATHCCRCQDGNGNSTNKKTVLTLFKGEDHESSHLLEIGPVRSRRLIEQGYLDAMQQISRRESQQEATLTYTLADPR
ncbi:MAG TPA: patatin-like phospholipase family protein [Candidatus Obscuribacterales bacterium]